jgi:hypothetical protein
VLDDPVAVAVDFGTRLDLAGVRWVAGGSIASSVHGEARSTMDVDMVIALDLRRVTTLAAAVAHDYYADADTMRDAVATATSFNAVHLASAIKVDCFVAGDDPFEVERLSARQRVDTPSGVLYVDTAEHTLLRKLEWYRRGGEASERQWRDVEAIVRIQGDRLNRDYLRRWADRLRVSDLLDRVL